MGEFSFGVTRLVAKQLWLAVEGFAALSIGTAASAIYTEFCLRVLEVMSLHRRRCAPKPRNTSRIIYVPTLLYSSEFFKEQGQAL